MVTVSTVRHIIIAVLQQASEIGVFGGERVQHTLFSKRNITEGHVLGIEGEKDISKHRPELTSPNKASQQLGILLLRPIEVLGYDIC